MQEIKICRGLPCSGKSTWSIDFVEKNTTFVRVCRDDLRLMRGKYWLPEQESLITQWEETAIDSAIKKGFNVVIDAMNLKPEYIRKIFKKYYPKHIITLRDFFDVSVDECLKRNAVRSSLLGEKKVVGDEIIKDNARKYLSKSLDVSSKEFIKSLYEQPIQEEEEAIVQNEELPHALICDLDGSLCLHNGRGPFEYHKCGEDLLNKPIAKVLEAFQEKFKIFYFSGREDSCKIETIKWLAKHNLLFENSRLEMRKTGDFRKDTIIKKEMFEEHIKNRYFVDFVIDDRPSVINMWKSLGLFVFDVGEGIDF